MLVTSKDMKENVFFLLQMMWKFIGIFAALVLVSVRGDPVYILSENMQQMITSTSLQWVPADKHSKIDFQDAVVGAHQEVEGKFANQSFFQVFVACLYIVIFNYIE